MKDSATREPLRGAHGCATADTCVGDPGCEVFSANESCWQVAVQREVLDAATRAAYDDGRGDGLYAACPTCAGPIRETVGMVCQTCGTDYASDGQTRPVPVVNVTPDPRLHAHEPGTPVPTDCPDCALKQALEHVDRIADRGGRAP